MISIVLCAIALIVWRYPLVIARKLIPAAPDDISNSISAAETASVACIVLGLWTLGGLFLHYSGTWRSSRYIAQTINHSKVWRVAIFHG